MSLVDLKVGDRVALDQITRFRKLVVCTVTNVTKHHITINNGIRVEKFRRNTGKAVHGNSYIIEIDSQVELVLKSQRDRHETEQLVGDLSMQLKTFNLEQLKRVSIFFAQLFAQLNEGDSTPHG